MQNMSYDSLEWLTSDKGYVKIFTSSVNIVDPWTTYISTVQFHLHAHFRDKYVDKFFWDLQQFETVHKWTT